MTNKDRAIYISRHGHDLVAQIYEPGMTIGTLQAWLDDSVAGVLRDEVGLQLAGLKAAGIVDDKTTVAELIPPPKPVEPIED